MKTTPSHDAPANSSAQGFLDGRRVPSDRRHPEPVRESARGLCARSRTTCSGASRARCGISNGAGKIPFICFDLAGGANIAGSNVLVGKRRRPARRDQRRRATASSACRATGPRRRRDDRERHGQQRRSHRTRRWASRSTATARSYAACSRASRRPTIGANINGAVIPARSENDTGNNPHNPLYGIQKAGADGSILTLIGSQNSDLGRQFDGAADDDQSRSSGRRRSIGRAT